MLVGPPAAGKTTVRAKLLAAGLPPDHVVSLDDLRRAVAAQVQAAGGPVRAPQDWTVRALRCAARRQSDLLASGSGYLADNTHLRRRERVRHVRAAHDAGLPAVAVLLPELPVAVLARRDAAREAGARVPELVLLRFAHRRSLLDPAVLREEGFDEVVEADGGTCWHLRRGTG